MPNHFGMRVHSTVPNPNAFGFIIRGYACWGLEELNWAVPVDSMSQETPATIAVKEKGVVTTLATALLNQFHDNFICDEQPGWLAAWLIEHDYSEREAQRARPVRLYPPETRVVRGDGSEEGRYIVTPAWFNEMFPPERESL